MDSKPISYAEILRRGEGSRGSLQNIPHFPQSPSGGTPQRSRNTSGTDPRPGTEAYFQDSISRNNPKFHSFPRRQINPPPFRPDRVYEGGNNSLPRRRGRTRQRADDFSGIEGRKSFPTSKSFDEGLEEPRDRPSSMIIQSENPIPLPCRLLHVLDAHERSKSPMWRPNQPCLSFSDMLRAHNESQIRPMGRITNTLERKVSTDSEMSTRHSHTITKETNPLGLESLPDDTILRRQRTESGSSWATVAAIIPEPKLDGSEHPVPKVVKDEVLPTVYAICDEHQDAVKEIDPEGFEKVLNRHDTILRRQRTESGSSWAAVAAIIPEPKLDGSEYPVPKVVKDEVLPTVYAISDEHQDAVKEIHSEGFEKVLNRRERKSKDNDSLLETCKRDLDLGTTGQNFSDDKDEILSSWNVGNPKKSFEYQDDLSSAWLEIDANPFVFDDEEQPQKPKRSEFIPRTSINPIGKGQVIRNIHTSSLMSGFESGESCQRSVPTLQSKSVQSKWTAKKAYECQDELSSAWMDEDSISFEFEDEDEPIERKSDVHGSSFVSKVLGPSQTDVPEFVNQVEAGNLLKRNEESPIGLLARSDLSSEPGCFQKKAYQYQDALSSVWMQQDSNPFVFDDSDDGGVFPQATCALENGKKGDKPSHLNECPDDWVIPNKEAVRGEDHFQPPLKKAYEFQDRLSNTWIEDDCNPFDFGDDVGVITASDSRSTCSKSTISQNEESPHLPSDDLERDVRPSSDESPKNLGDLDKGPKANLQTQAPPPMPTLPKKAFELQNDLSSTWMEDDAKFFDFGDDEDQSPKVQSKERKEELKEKRAFEMLDDFSGSWMEEAPEDNPFQNMSEAEDVPLPKSPAAIQADRPFDNGATFDQKNVPTTTNMAPAWKQEVSKKVNLEGSIFGSSIGKKKLEHNVMSSSSFDESQGKNTGEEEEVKTRDKVRKKKRRPKAKDRESSSESDKDCDWEQTFEPTIIESSSGERVNQDANEAENRSWAQIASIVPLHIVQDQENQSKKEHLIEPELPLLIVPDEADAKTELIHADEEGFVEVQSKHRKRLLSQNEAEPRISSPMPDLLTACPHAETPDKIESISRGKDDKIEPPEPKQNTQNQVDEDENFRMRASRSRFVPVAEGNKPPDDPINLDNWSQDYFWWNRSECEAAEKRFVLEQQKKHARSDKLRNNTNNNQGDDDDSNTKESKNQIKRNKGKESKPSPLKSSHEQKLQNLPYNWSDESTYLKVEIIREEKVEIKTLQETPQRIRSEELMNLQNSIQVDIGHLENDVREIEKILSGMSNDDADRQLAITKITVDTLDAMESSADDIANRMNAIPEQERQELGELETALKGLKLAIVQDKITADKIRMSVENYVNERRKRNDEIKSYHNMLVDLEEWLLEAQGSLGAEIRMYTIKAVRENMKKHKDYANGLSEKREDVNQMLQQCSRLAQYPDVSEPVNHLSRHLTAVGEAIDDFKGVMNLRNRALQVRIV
ncbi:hypothetical protein TCAL_15308 [Tigriopus californicus]|uniref:Uncharacterized protein n=1 Tax=Tigriopus californicus TaxID=6832 RepID=A0A553PMF6_TIGCA|nr:hypothetical protein TCAL_15308 [Tigriopus californicus]